MRHVEAPYEGGLLRPTEPLSLRSGETVELIVLRRPDPKAASRTISLPPLSTMAATCTVLSAAEAAVAAVQARPHLKAFAAVRFDIEPERGVDALLVGLSLRLKPRQKVWIEVQRDFDRRLWNTDGCPREKCLSERRDIRRVDVGIAETLKLGPIRS